MEMKVFAGRSSRDLVEKMCAYLDMPSGAVLLDNFKDGEIRVEINENVRGREVYVCQSISAPVNDHLMELLIMLDALKRASARRITAVLPYYGYARQDRKVKPRVPITAKLVADLITVAGADRVICMDLHVGQIQGFFNIPVDNVFALPIFLPYIKENFCSGPGACIIAPDAGGVERARAYAKRLGADLAIIDKRRDAPNSTDEMRLIGKVENKQVVIVDDLVDTAGTLVAAANVLKAEGALNVYACCVHPVLSGPAIQRLTGSVIEKLVVTDTIALRAEARQCPKIAQVSIADILAESIRRCYNAESVSRLFA